MVGNFIRETLKLPYLGKISLISLQEVLIIEEEADMGNFLLEQGDESNGSHYDRLTLARRYFPQLSIDLWQGRNSILRDGELQRVRNNWATLKRSIESVVSSAKVLQITLWYL